MKMFVKVVLPVALLAVGTVSANWFENHSNSPITIEVYKGRGSKPTYEKRELPPKGRWHSEVTNINRIVVQTPRGTAEYLREKNDRDMQSSTHYTVKNDLKLYGNDVELNR